jgi:5-phospho-D-xylono-1,4-lactonase
MAGVRPNTERLPPDHEPVAGRAGPNYYYADPRQCGGGHRPRRAGFGCIASAFHSGARTIGRVNGFVRTVLGDVPPGELGPTYCHEHLITRPAPRFGDDLRLDDEDKAAEELDRFRFAGGRALVDATTPEFGRDAAGLRRLAERSSIHVVATTGHVSDDYWRGVIDLDDRSEDSLVAEYVLELSSGIDGGPTRAGVVKAGTSAGGPTVTEAKLLRAAAAAQRETGAPITTHTTAGTGALAQTEVLARAGADLTHVCIGHIDRLLDWELHLELARRGVFLGYDCISKEQYAPDAERARFIALLVEEGHGGQICLSGDLARRSYLEAWGGSPGYRYILESFLPQLRATGLDDESVRALVVDNAGRFLAWR